MKFTIDEFLEKLPLPPTPVWTEGKWDVEPFERGGVTLVFFAPRSVDHQTFHDRDEFYFIARGTGEVVIGGERQTFTAGDAFFVGALVEHKFENFSEDFATWAVFFLGGGS